MSMHKMLLRAALVLAIALPAMAEPKDQVVEVACGSCIYEMDGVEGCEAAVKIDGRPYLLKGVKGLDAHAAGLCKSAKHARVLGEVKDGVFVAKGFQLVAIEEIAEAGCGSCIYRLPGAKGCPLAVKVGDTAYLVTGNVNTDAMALDLCTKPKPAKIAGTIQGDKFDAILITVFTIDQTAEVACATCIYEMEGVSGCQAAVKIDGKPYLIEGLGDFNAHAAGLCDAAKPAHVLGNITDGKFVAELLEFEPTQDGADHQHGGHGTTKTEHHHAH